LFKLDNAVRVSNGFH